MRRTLIAVVAAVACLVGAAACQPAEPSMKITAKVYDQYDQTPPGTTTCGYAYTVRGTVTPPAATGTVVLQRTVGGKWTDVKGWDNADGYYTKSASVRQANVSATSGAYRIKYLVDWYGSTRHYRVRSAGGAAVSASFYLSPDGWDGVCG